MSKRHSEPMPIELNERKSCGPHDFDLDYYLEMAKGFEMSEEEKIELLTILWDIMRRFVEMSFGLDSISILEDKTSEKPSENAGFLVK